jgi:hypothetical protein
MYKKYNNVKCLLREIYNKDENKIPITPVSSPVLLSIDSPILSDFPLLNIQLPPLMLINKDVLMEYIVLTYLFTIALFMQLLKSLFI